MWSDPAAVRAALLMGQLSQNTMGSYSAAWRQWAQFCMITGAPTTPEGLSPRDFEEVVLNYLVSELAGQRCSPGTVASRLYGVRYGLLTLGEGDILLRFPRVRMALRTLKRLKRKQGAKLPVTPEMLHWLATNLRLGQRGSEPDSQDVRVWTVVVLSFFYLLRISEALNLVFGDLQPRRDGAYVKDWGQVSATTVLISGSKTDQYNLGCLRTQFRVGGVICPVGAVKVWASTCGTEPSSSIAGSGRGRVTRELVQHWLRAAATASGVPPSRIGTHSLRVGGATAMHRAGWELPRIQRFGRWSSGAFHGYLWDHHEMTEGVAASMLKGQGTLHVGVFYDKRPGHNLFEGDGRASRWSQLCEQWRTGGRRPPVGKGYW